MLKREITYEDFNGNEVTDVFYFHVSKPELLELETESERGFAGIIEHIVETRDSKKLVALFKRIILMGYGQRSEDGKRFIKSDQLCEEFSQTAAYQTLFMELASDDQKAIDFLYGMLPKDLVESMQASENQAVASGNPPTSPPAAPTPPPTKNV